MSQPKRTFSKRTASPKTQAGKRLSGAAGRRPSSPLLNQSHVRGLLGPSLAAATPNAENRGMLSFLDQWGGIDGVMSTMTKVQKMIRMFQQFGPLLNMFGSFGSFFGGKAATTSLPPTRRILPDPRRNRRVGRSPDRPSGRKPR